MKRPVRTELSRKNMLSRGIPVHFMNVTLDDFHTYNDKLLVKAKNYVENYLSDVDKTAENGDGIFFYGSNGTGKSMMASIIVKEAYRHRYSSKRITFVDYINEYTRIWKARDLSEKEQLEDMFYSYIKAVDFLVIEEVGKEQTTRDMSVTVLEDCLRYREEHCLCTIICTNMSLGDLMNRYNSKSVESLIKGHMKPLKMVGEDQRVGG